MVSLLWFSGDVKFVVRASQPFIDFPRSIEHLNSRSLELPRPSRGTPLSEVGNSSHGDPTL